MDNSPSWAVTIAAVAVGVSPGLAILSTRLIARVLHLALWPRPRVTPMLGPEPAPKNRPPIPGGAQGGLMTASMLENRGQGRQAAAV